jgi:hypothetical protein
MGCYWQESFDVVSGKGKESSKHQDPKLQRKMKIQEPSRLGAVCGRRAYEAGKKGWKPLIGAD